MTNDPTDPDRDGDDGPARHAPDNAPQQGADLGSRDGRDPSPFDL